MEILLALPAGRVLPACSCPVLPLHMAYRIVPGPRLQWQRAAPPPSGGAMLLVCAQVPGDGDPAMCCRQIITECSRRHFTGVLCDFEGPPTPGLTRLVEHLAPLCLRQGLFLVIPESYATFAPDAQVLISSALTSGTLERRLESAFSRYPRSGPVLAVEWMREDFLLPAAGRGEPLSQAALEEQLHRLEPAVFFDRGLCAHYYTYMAAGGQAHFVIFDTPRSIREKLATARRLGVTRAILPLPELETCLDEVLVEP